ncbi:outer membrane protein assembly factor BamA [Ferribacterium limneticum]|uniref:outer membrane protein assembly factor BamA n=1 Tax=Ferribacterium limneticum TaxID=76259 RepID=UPI001CFAE255|nr:outer membrane protein assembly factor BamA [Ferribacterium limneticum]UCV26956.1 outer membrane protein assembly factor BamA [Ferribacterium limneticum]UCV30873.1 outer membrane protein assembly factor BamA [Ferribacterium limneticum]
MKKSLLSILIAGMFATPALAFEPFAVKDIRVEGIQRTEAGTVFGYLPVKVGETLTDEKAAQSIKALFATGFFKDVRIEVEKDVMVVVVQERPAVATINFVGLKEFDKDVIIKALKETGIAEGRIFDRALLEKAEQELKRQYLTRGKYAANITTTVTPLERNRVGVNFNIEEGSAAKIKQINIVGAKSFREKDLLAQFELTTPSLITWYTKNDQYSRQKLSADLEKLKSFYMNQGYLEFAVESTQVSISPDKQDVYITANINEGDRYQVSSVKMAGDFSMSEDELKKLVTIKPGDVFSRDKLNATTKAISDRLGKEGYAFANVNAAPEIDKEKRHVAFTIFVDPGKRVYVRRLNITGNTKTRDEVVRREMRQMEGGWYDADKVTASKQRVDKLGFFSEVAVETPAVAGTSDQLDVNVNVTEKPTGNLMLGVGTSSTDKVILSGSIAQNNFMGSGNNVAIQVNSAKTYRTYVFSYTNPYFTQDGVSQGFDVYHRTVNTTSTTLAYYSSSSTGGGIRFGFPIGEKESIGLGLGLDSTSITTYTETPSYYKDFVNKFGETNISVPLTLSWASDGKDSYFFPTKGTFQKASLEVALPGGDLTYYRASYQLQHFVPLNSKFTLMLNGEYGMANGYGTSGLPFFKNYYAGGVTSVRGYKASSLGPVYTDPSTNTQYRLGGNRRVIGNAELLWSLPGMDKSFRMGWFFDVGQVFGSDEKLDMADLRYSSGLSAAWISPIGPLKFSFGRPLNKKESDKSEVFQFQLGTTF